METRQVEQARLEHATDAVIEAYEAAVVRWWEGERLQHPEKDRDRAFRRHWAQAVAKTLLEEAF